MCFFFLVEISQNMYDTFLQLYYYHSYISRAQSSFSLLYPDRKLSTLFLDRISGENFSKEAFIIRNSDQSISRISIGKRHFNMR